jgi:hypothetical protein
MAHYSVTGTFWKGIAEYVTPFTQQDLDFCKVERVRKMEVK